MEVPFQGFTNLINMGS